MHVDGLALCVGRDFDLVSCRSHDLPESGRGRSGKRVRDDTTRDELGEQGLDIQLRQLVGNGIPDDSGTPLRLEPAVWGPKPRRTETPPSDNSLREAPLYTYNGAPSPATFVGTARPTKSARRDPATPVRLAAASLTIMSSAGGSLGTASKTMRERFD